MSEYTGGSDSADHLAVLVHGLWGNETHLFSLAKALRAAYPPEQLHILVAKSNSGFFTYDGIELGGERVCIEIEEVLAAVAARGGNITKFSIVGYSLGGLVARYCVGLMEAKGMLDGLECMSYTAFASPFLGVRSPTRSRLGHIYNVTGARTLATSGRQMFGIDRFRDTGRPLLAVMADPKSIFVRGLAKFRRRVLYSNVVNDNVAVFYTTFMSPIDPFSGDQIDRVRPNYVRGYEPVVMDGANPVEYVNPDGSESDDDATTATANDSSRSSAHATEADGNDVQKKSSFFSKTPRLTKTVNNWVKRVPLLVALSLFLPFGLVAFFLNAAVQTVRSTCRVRLHESGRAGIDSSRYRVNLWINELRGAVEGAYEGAYENINSTQGNEYLSDSSSESGLDVGGVRGGGTAAAIDADNDAMSRARERRKSAASLGGGKASYAPPTLALAPWQFAAIESLGRLGWRKYPVWIHDDRHSHAAIITRKEKATRADGKMVMKHWIKEEFLA